MRRELGSHQRVVMTRWWLFWARSSAEGARKPPTSHDDSLVVVLGEVKGRRMWKATNESWRLVGGFLGEVEGGRRLKATNESKRLVGGLFGRGQGRRDVESHQRVVMTRWWLFWARSRAEGCGRRPTSHGDSLVVVLGDIECGGS